MDGTAAIHPERRRGRGAVSNASGRYESERREALDDGWGNLDEPPPPLRTTVTRDASRSIIARNTSPDIPFDRSINPYRGCEHGCVYCFARPTHAHLGFSPGLDFESRILVKPEAAALLRRELAQPRYRCQPIAFGTNTDPYQPLEKEWRITRQLLELLETCNHPVTIVTKSALVLRDADILAAMAKRNLVKVALSVTTLDRKLARRMEPRAATPERRLEAIAGLAAAGVPTAVMAAPMIPGLNDPELEAILERARAAGATEAGYILLRLPLEIKDLWREWLAEHYPDRADKVMTLVRATQSGRDYDATFGKRQTGSGVYAEMIRKRFRLAVKRLGLNERKLDLDCSAFVAPAAPTAQLSLL